MPYQLKDFEAENDYGLIDEGDYEAIIEKIEIKISKAKNEYVSLTFRIRDDVEQKFQKRVLFDNLFKEKNDKGEYTEHFNRKKITKIVKAVFPENTPLEFNSFDDVCDAIIKHKLIIHVGITKEEDEYTGKKQNYIYYYKPTDKGDKVLTPTKPVTAQADTKAVEYDEEKLPF